MHYGMIDRVWPVMCGTHTLFIRQILRHVLAYVVGIQV